jgi:hypothetical protein
VKRSFIILFVFFFLAQGAAVSAEVVVVKAEGSARRQEDEAATKLGALNDALTNAVVTALDSLLSEGSRREHSSELDALIEENGSTYVLHYRVHKEGWVTHHDEYARSGAERALDEEPADEAPGGSFGSLEEFLDSDRPLSGVEFYHLWIEVKVDVGRLRKDTRRLTAAGEDATTPVEVVIVGVRNYAAFESIKVAVSRTGIVKDVNYGSFVSGRVVLRAEVQGSAHLLWEKLDAEMGKEYVLIPFGTDRLIIRYEGGEGKE